MLSIAMTTYNGEKYLREQLDSILNQTYSDFELIICDDCSKDNTRVILSDYAAKDSRIKIFMNEENLGFKKNFEKAISLCSGEYIALSDQDDIWLENHLDVLVNILGNYDIACGNAELIDSDGISYGRNLNETDGLFSFENNDNLLYRILANYGGFQGASMLIKKSLLEKALPIPEKVLYHDSWFVACSCFLNHINYSFEIITKYRQHKNQVTLHEKQSYLVKIKNALIRILKKEKYSTDRFAYIEEIQKRFSLSEEQSKIIKDCYNIQLMRSKKIGFFRRIFVNKIFKRNYKKIYTCDTYKFYFSRALKNIF